MDKYLIELNHSLNKLGERKEGRTVGSMIVKTAVWPWIARGLGAAWKCSRNPACRKTVKKFLRDTAVADVAFRGGKQLYDEKVTANFENCLSLIISDPTISIDDMNSECQEMLKDNIVPYIEILYFAKMMGKDESKLDWEQWISGGSYLSEHNGYVGMGEVNISQIRNLSWTGGDPDKFVGGICSDNLDAYIVTGGLNSMEYGGTSYADELLELPIGDDAVVSTTKIETGDEKLGVLSYKAYLVDDAGCNSIYFKINTLQTAFIPDSLRKMVMYLMVDGVTY